MHRFLLIIFLACCLFSCKQNTSEERIRVLDTSMSWLNDIDTTMFLGVNWYAPYNIILLDSVSDIYFYGLSFTHSFNNEILPAFHLLRPQYFEKTDDLGKIKEVVLARVLSGRTNKWIYLIYNRDTIRDKRYFILEDFFESKGIRVSTRMPTEEENAVLNSIMRGEKYKPHLIEWRNTVSVPDSSWLVENLYWFNQPRK